uniref:Double jelly roll-like domain-containing protein n=1 Tax=Glossina morsitans morsitans TaxID=37546 RepID=A0A1B0G3T0_GLOMM
MDIGGILEAEKPFYRHFNLKYENVDVPTHKNDSIENHNNDSDESGDDDDDDHDHDVQHNNEINDVNNIDYNGIEVEADNYVAMDNNDVEVPTFNSLLNMLLGFAEDFNKIIVNSKHELILLRSKDDKQTITTTLANEQIKLSILNIKWKMPHVQLADAYKLEVFKKINSRQTLNICFRTWDMYYYTTLPQSATVLWNVKLASENERPRFLLIAFRNAENKFTHCNLTNVKVHLNSDSYPYDDLNLRFSRNQFALLYDMYSRFQQSYYLRDPYPLLKRNEFLTHTPLVVLDVTHQNESVKTGPIDIRIELKASSNIPANTSAYCLIIHDKIFEYVALTNEERKIL